MADRVQVESTYGEAADVLVTGSARLSAFHAGGDSLMGRYFSYRMHPAIVPARTFLSQLH